MSSQAILDELRALGTESCRKVLLKHRAGEPCYGVKIGDMKKIQKRVGKDHRLALELYDSGVYDAMYLAGLIADDAAMTKKDLQRWVKKARGGSLAGTTVPSVAAGSPHGTELALEWIQSPDDSIAEAGWATLAMIASVTKDAQLDLALYERLLERVEKEIHSAQNFTRYQMNGFVICVAAYVVPLHDRAVQAAARIGSVTVDMGETACEVPYAPDYIRKIAERGAIGKKRKSAKC